MTSVVNSFALTKEELVEDFARLGVPRGGLMMVHSSLRGIGHVDGGGRRYSSIRALHALGPDGTLVVPTFTDRAAKRELIKDGAITALDFGHSVDLPEGELRVVQPSKIYETG